MPVPSEVSAQGGQESTAIKRDRSNHENALTKVNHHATLPLAQALA